jgi:hypothetical protein
MDDKKPLPFVYQFAAGRCFIIRIYNQLLTDVQVPWPVYLK